MIGKAFCMKLTTAPAPVDEHHARIDAALLSGNMVLTATYRQELAILMSDSNDPLHVMRVGLAIYRQGIHGGDTSVCVSLLEQAAGKLKSQRSQESLHL